MPPGAKGGKRALAAFRRRAVKRSTLLGQRYGAAEARVITEGAEACYADLLPEVAALPKGMMNGALAATYEYLAYAKSMEARGHPAAEVGAFFDESYSALVNRVPRWLGRLVFWIARPWVKARMRREAKDSQSSSVDGGWRFSFVEGEAESGGFGFDVQSCAVCSTFERHSAGEYVPFLCALDDKMSEVFGMGLRRSGTIARGSSCCDFRFQAGGEARPLSQLTKSTPRDVEVDLSRVESGVPAKDPP